MKNFIRNIVLVLAIHVCLTEQFYVNKEQSKYLVFLT